MTVSRTPVHDTRAYGSALAAASLLALKDTKSADKVTVRSHLDFVRNHVTRRNAAQRVFILPETLQP